MRHLPADCIAVFAANRAELRSLSVRFCPKTFLACMRGNGSHGKSPPKAQQIAHPLRLFLKPIEQDPVAYAGRIACSSHLKCHEPAVCRDYRIRGLAAFVVVEVGETGEILSRAIEAKHPDINVAPTALAAELFALAVSFNGGVKAGGKDAFWFVIGSGRLREVGHLASSEINY